MLQPIVASALYRNMKTTAAYAAECDLRSHMALQIARSIGKHRGYERNQPQRLTPDPLREHEAKDGPQKARDPSTDLDHQWFL